MKKMILLFFIALIVAFRQFLLRFQKKDLGQKTLVVFAYHEANALEARNLDYFIRMGIWDNDHNNFIIVVNGPKCTPCDHGKFKSLGNVKFLYRPNKGYDFGAYHFALSSVDRSVYRYFVFLNSGVRGPLLPAYAAEHLIKGWPSIFTNLINEKV